MRLNAEVLMYLCLTIRLFFWILFNDVKHIYMYLINMFDDIKLWYRTEKLDFWNAVLNFKEMIKKIKNNRDLSKFMKYMYISDCFPL